MTIISLALYTLPDSFYGLWIIWLYSLQWLSFVSLFLLFGCIHQEVRSGLQACKDEVEVRDYCQGSLFELFMLS